MRITDPRWPAVREAARTLLREDELLVYGPSWLEAPFHQLTIAMGDHLPSKLSFPEFRIHEKEAFIFYAHSPSIPLVHCGLNEPPLDVVWIPLDAQESWLCVESTALDLLEAGYPGCVGCAGVEAEQPWDETASRKRIKTDEINE